MGFSFLFPALGGLLYGYDIGATSGATISIEVHAIHTVQDIFLFDDGKTYPFLVQ